MKIVNLVCSFMDKLEEFMESSGARSMIGTFLVLSFLLGLISVEMNTRGLMPDFLSGYVPVKHLVIIAQVFTLILCIEVISLVLSFIHSVSISMGKQIEVLSLVLLRDIFKQFSNFTEPIDWLQIKPFLVPMVSSAAGAFIIFLILGFYYRLHQSRPISDDGNDTKSFIKIKKIISFFLLVSFLIIITHEAISFFTTGHPNKTFESFYTILIFSDILIILFSMRYSSNYIVTFRNSGFAVATIFMRVSLMSPAPYNALLGIGSACFVVGISRHYMYCTSTDLCK